MRGRHSIPGRSEMIFFVSELFRPNVKSTQLPIPLISQLSSPGLSHLGMRLTAHSPPSSDKVKNEWSYISTPHTPSCSAKGNFTSLLFYPFLCMRMKLECQLLIRTKTVKHMQWTADWFYFDSPLFTENYYYHHHHHHYHRHLL